MKLILLSVGLAIALVPTSFALAEMYRWTDASGSEHFTTDLNAVPPAYRAAAMQGAGAARGHVNFIPSPSRNQSVRDESSAAPRREPKKEREDEKIGGRDESGWRMAAERYASQITQLEQAVDACEGKNVPIEYNPDTGRRMKRQHYDRQMDALDRCSENRSRLDATRRQLANFEKRAHEQGVPPGWLRAR